LTGFGFGWFVLEPISEYIQDREGELTKGNTLSYGQKVLYYWWYVDAQEHGVTRTYDEKGNVKEETIYENVKEISRKKVK
jgi:antitoxin component YwqK of YwqJK toxin-antitoxin module